MLKTPVLHPLILGALGRAGHGSRILIADGNYPFRTKSPSGCEIVYLNFQPGLLDVIQVLKGVCTLVPLESAAVMAPPAGTPAPIFDEFSSILGGMDLERLPRFDFYDQASHRETAMVIATGEQRRFANILLTIGVIRD